MQRRITLNAAPLGALFLLLAAFVAATGHPAKGLMVTIATASPCGLDNYRLVVVRSLSHGRVRINSEDLKREDLGARLQDIFRSRAERLAFVAGDPDLSFGEVAQVIATTARYVNHVAIVTPSVEKAADWRTGNCLEPNLRPPLTEH
jgi:biopolymer transport protein TolR